MFTYCFYTNTSMAMHDKDLAKIAEKIMRGSRYLQASTYQDFIAKAPQISGNHTMIFRVKVFHDKRTFRDIELACEGTLEDLHLMIQQAFDFDYDHLYAFFLDKK